MTNDTNNALAAPPFDDLNAAERALEDARTELRAEIVAIQKERALGRKREVEIMKRLGVKRAYSRRASKAKPRRTGSRKAKPAAAVAAAPTPAPAPRPSTSRRKAPVAPAMQTSALPAPKGA